MSGARFEQVTLDEEIGPEIVLMLTDLTPFAQELKQKLPALRLKSGVARTSIGPVLFLLWWIPPVTNGEPFALYEHVLNPTHAGVLKILRQVARQTHLHLFLLGPDQELLDVYEFESNFGLNKLIWMSERACRQYGEMDFIRAKEEYDRTHELMQLFSESEPEWGNGAEAPEDTDREDQFLITRSSRELIESAVRLIGELSKHPSCTPKQRNALATAMVGFTRLPKTTPGLSVDFGFSIRAGGDLRYWSVHFDDRTLMWSVGGCVHGPYGSDSFTSFQLSLLHRSQDNPIGDAEIWLELDEYLTEEIDVQANDMSDEDLRC
jgi:hypothetical protein